MSAPFGHFLAGPSTSEGFWQHRVIRRVFGSTEYFGAFLAGPGTSESFWQDRVIPEFFGRSQTLDTQSNDKKALREYP
jgi:hypothetical protein